ncbi:hypothetical protein GCM10010519_23190 [Streptomyces lactacystinicus]
MTRAVRADSTVSDMTHPRVEGTGGARELRGTRPLAPGAAGAGKVWCDERTPPVPRPSEPVGAEERAAAIGTEPVEDTETRAPRPAESGKRLGPTGRRWRPRQRRSAADYAAGGRGGVSSGACAPSKPARGPGASAFTLPDEPLTNP